MATLLHCLCIYILCRAMAGKAHTQRIFHLSVSRASHKQASNCSSSKPSTRDRCTAGQGLNDKGTDEREDSDAYYQSKLARKQ